MNYNVQGYHETRKYRVEKTGESKPFITYESEYRWETILRFSNDCTLDKLLYNKSYDTDSYLLIGDDDYYSVQKSYFRADLNEMIVKVWKKLSVNGIEEDVMEKYKEELKKYYEDILEKYPKVKRHIEMYNPKDPMENIDEIVNNVVNNNGVDYVTISYDGVLTGVTKGFC